jgi:hypothetical protein
VYVTWSSSVNGVSPPGTGAVHEPPASVRATSVLVLSLFTCAVTAEHESQNTSKSVPAEFTPPPTSGNTG